jgi:3-oxoacyl-[acyl-carrier-protein] synthase-1
MLKNKYIAKSLNIDNAIDESEKLKLANKYIEKKEFTSFMSNSFGFGGTNVSLIIKEFKNS